MAQNYSCPWINVECLEDFLYYCCPECNDRHQSRDDFLQHALNEHPEAKNYLVPIIGNKKITVPKNFQLLYRPVSTSPTIHVKNEFEYERKIEAYVRQANHDGEQVKMKPEICRTNS